MVSRECRDHEDSKFSGSCPIFARTDQGLADSFAAGSLLDEKFRNVAEPPFVLDDVNLVLLFVCNGPADGLAGLVVGDENASVALVRTCRQYSVELLGDAGVNAPVAFYFLLKVLEFKDETKNGLLIIR